LRSALRPMRWEWAEIPPSPGRGVRFADAHLHLFDYPDPGTQVRYAHAQRTILLSSAVDGRSSEATLAVARGAPEDVKAFVGVHPSEAEKEKDLGWLEDALKRAAGLGEVGLDPTYSNAGPGSAQLRVFLAQLEAAEEAGKPLQVHSRGAEGACLEELSGFRLRSVLMHWFQGEESLAAATDAGYFVSFGPALLASKKLQRMAVAAPRDRVLTETDGPVTFAPLGTASGPALIPSVTFKLAQLWKTGFEEAREGVLGNFRRYLGPSEKG
jgi:TatD DNase family protein